MLRVSAVVVLALLTACKSKSEDASCNTCDSNITREAALRQTCDKGEALGCHYLARMYENGTGGVDKDLDKAHDYYSRACKGGYKPACGFAEAVAKSR